MKIERRAILRSSTEESYHAVAYVGINMDVYYRIPMGLGKELYGNYWNTAAQYQNVRDYILVQFNYFWYIFNRILILN